MPGDIDLTSDEIKMAGVIARKVSYRWPTVERDDIEGELYLWLCENYKWVVRYRTEPGGPSKLFKALHRAGNKFALKQYEAATGVRVIEEASGYTTAMIRRILPVALDTEQWPQATPAAQTGQRHDTLAHDYTYTDEALVLLADVARAAAMISEEQQELLDLHYRRGLPYRDVATIVNRTEKAVERACDRAVDAVHRALANKEAAE